MELSKKARELRNKYQRDYRVKHPEKIRQYFKTYWEKRAANYTPDLRAKELKEQGWTQRQIADELGVSAATVNTILNKR